MDNIINFLKNLYVNNNREWFLEHKAEYKEIEKNVNTLTENLIEGIGSFDPTVGSLAVKNCTYRIYRDIRFSSDKTPYKTHIGIYICPGGKKSGNAGYYFHIEPQGRGLLGGNLLTSGLYMPEKEALQSVREDILYSGDVFQTAIDKAKGFFLDMEGALKRIPSGFPSDSPYSEYLKLKNICLVKNITNEELRSPDLLKRVINDFKKTVDFNNFLNRAVQYAREEK